MTQGPGAATQGPGAALRGLDTALEKIAAQQKKEETSTGSTTYVAKVTNKKKMSTLTSSYLKVSSRQTSRRQSVSATNGEEVRKNGISHQSPVFLPGHLFFF